MSDVFNRVKAALADSYAVEREIGSGGMATVYLAQDLKHRRNVAVKVLRPELAATLGPERFLREIEVAAQLTHPHILPLHDSGEASGFLYYVMPYIEGESLRDRLAREGSLPITDAIRIVREVVDALASAHRNGVVHRDIKPDNIMLSQNHALVTDFGVAKAVSEATGREKLTTAGVALGTPSYMAPEQATADPNIDQRVDIYAVGAVTYELLAGKPPFSGATSQAVLAAHVTEIPAPVTDHRNAVPPALANIVMRCLEKNRADRWQTADELLPQLEALSTPSGGVTPTTAVPLTTAAPGRRNVNWMLALVAGLVALVGIPATVMFRGGASEVEPTRDRLLVSIFENETGDPSLDHVGKIFADWLARGIQETELVDVVDPRAATSWVEGDQVRSPRELAVLMGASTVVSGAYYRQGDSLQIQANLVTAETGDVLSAMEPVIAPVSDPLEAAQLLAQRVMGGVAATFPDVFLGGEFHSERTPRSYEVWREYLSAVEIFMRVSQSGAIPHFQRVLEVDSTFYPAATMLAVIYINAGRWAQADSIVRWLGVYRDRMTQVERHELDWLAAEVAGDLGRAFRARDALVKLIPPHPVPNFLLGYYAYRTNRLEYAVQVLDAELRFDDWGQYWADLGDALHKLGRHDREFEVATMGRDALPDDRPRLRQWLRAIIGLGRIGEVRGSVDEVMTFPSGSPGEDLAAIADELHAHGHQEDVADFRRRAVAWYREAAEESDSPGLRRNLAVQLYASGASAEAREILRELVDATDDSVDDLGWLGVVVAAEGDDTEADEIDAQLQALDRPYLHGQNTAFRAWIAAARGRRDRAVALLTQAHREGFAFGLWTHDDPALDSLRGYGPFEEFIRPRSN